MRWDFSKSNLKWYEYLWAALPLALMGIGGAIGGGCGGIAAAFNINFMRSKRSVIQKYSLTGIVSVAAVGSWLLLARLLLVTTGLGGVSVDAADQQLAKFPMYVAISKAEPDTYLKMRETIRDVLNHGGSETAVGAAVKPYVASLIVKYLPLASDDALVQSIRITTLEIDQIGAKSADACFNFLIPQPGAPPLDISQFVTAEVMKGDAAATSAVIETGTTSPQKIPSKEEIDSALRQVIGALVAQYGAAEVQGLAKPVSMDHGRYCALSSALYKEALTLASKESIPLLRFLVAQKPST